MSVAAAAKTLRLTLREVFPGVKFRVRSDRYFNSIEIIYADGPNQEAIDGIIQSLGAKTWKGIELVTARHVVTDKLIEHYRWVMRR